MRRFSTAAAAAILLFTATGFAGEENIQNCVTTGQSDMLRNAYLQCVACGVQTFTGKNPSEKWLATLASGAKSFRVLNAGETDRNKENITVNFTARDNMRKIVISQIQSYGFCTKQQPVDWPFVKEFITKKYDKSDKEVNELAKSLGFKSSGWLSKTNARDAFKSLIDDGRFTKDTKIEDKRQEFSETAKEIIDRKDADDDLKNCLNETKENRFPNQKAFDFCKAMATSCGITEQDFCGNGLGPVRLSGASTGGGQNNPPPTPVSQPAVQGQSRPSGPPPGPGAPVQ